ncbi:MAG: aldehyde ferredoxin oxidoreductase N-terminal domain-containing protein, partial [Deltaproteobacteria bacterium]
MKKEFYGWTGKHVRVDLTRGEIRVVADDPEIMHRFLGARGIGIKYMMDEMDPRMDAFEPNNRFIVATGPMTCMPPGGNRTYFITKSPLTGGIANAGVGGYFGAELKFAGYDFIMFEGKAKRPVYLWIHNDEIVLRNGEHLWGLGTQDSEEILLEETDPKAHIAAIGPAARAPVTPPVITFATRTRFSPAG